MRHITLRDLMSFSAGTTLLMGGLVVSAEAQIASSRPVEWVVVSAVDSSASGARLRLTAPDSDIHQVRADHLERHADTLMVSLPASLALREGSVDLTLRAFESDSDIRVTFSSADRDHRASVEGAELTIRRQAGRLAVYSASGTMRTRIERGQP